MHVLAFAVHEEQPHGLAHEEGEGGGGEGAPVSSADSSLSLGDGAHLQGVNQHEENQRLEGRWRGREPLPAWLEEAAPPAAQCKTLGRLPVVLTDLWTGGMVLE